MTLSVALTGCPNAAKDYDEFVETARSKAAPAPPSFLPPATTEKVDLSGSFVGFCKVSFAAADQSLLLGTVIKHDGATIDLVMTPLATTATTLNDTVGDPPVQASSGTLNNQFELKFPTINISGKANAISGSDIQVDAVVITGVAVSKDKIVAELDGQLIKPFKKDLTTVGDVCLFLRTTDGTLPPHPTDADFATSAGGAGAGGAAGSGG